MSRWGSSGARVRWGVKSDRRGLFSSSTVNKGLSWYCCGTEQEEGVNCKGWINCVWEMKYTWEIALWVGVVAHYLLWVSFKGVWYRQDTCETEQNMVKWWPSKIWSWMVIIIAGPRIHWHLDVHKHAEARIDSKSRIPVPRIPCHVFCWAIEVMWDLHQSQAIRIISPVGPACILGPNTVLVKTQPSPPSLTSQAQMKLLLYCHVNRVQVVRWFIWAT